MGGVLGGLARAPIARRDRPHLGGGGAGRPRAEELVRAEEFEGVMVRRIAAACGVSAAAVYRHFPSGDHLISAVAQRAREIMARDMFARLTVAADAAPIDRLRQFGESYVAFALAEPRLFRSCRCP